MINVMPVRCVVKDLQFMFSLVTGNASGKQRSGAANVNQTRVTLSSQTVSHNDSSSERTCCRRIRACPCRMEHR